LLETALYNGDLQSAETISKALKLINRQKVEIERLEIQVFTYSKKNYIKGIKDFAERLKELINPDWCKIHQQIDNIVKEMIGVGNESIRQEDC
jgi:hypothetical protein